MTEPTNDPAAVAALDAKEMAVLGKAPVGVKPSAQEAARAMRQLGRDVPGELYNEWLDWIDGRFGLPPTEYPPAPPITPGGPELPPPTGGATLSTPNTNDAPGARRAKHK